MNNSFIQQEEQSDSLVREQASERENNLVRLIETVGRIRESKDWCSLKESVFDGQVSRLRKELFAEAKKDDPNPNRLNRITGELKWAERYSDLKKYEDSLRVELQAIRKRYGKTE